MAVRVTFVAMVIRCVGMPVVMPVIHRIPITSRVVDKQSEAHHSPNIKGCNEDGYQLPNPFAIA
ncbi:hypothetical protein ABZV77_00290 [Streptomyces sp. NPDC004732]|uniref:hypothetical protein n=1 Tax=Streptomyces sp. NPDC004732 TaxID=3154290 RepID=UPI0033A78854